MALVTKLYSAYYVLARGYCIHVINIYLLGNFKGLYLNRFTIENVWENLQAP